MSNRPLRGETVPHVHEVTGPILSDVLAEAADVVRRYEARRPELTYPFFYSITQAWDPDTDEYLITIFVRN